MTTCSEVMTVPSVCCLARDTVEKVAQLMRTEEIGLILVIESEQSNKLIGIVTDRDLVMRLVAEGRDPKTTRVEEIMTPGVVTCSADLELHKAIELMAKHKLRRLPVVNSEDRILGIITQTDLAGRDSEAKTPAKRVRKAAPPS